MVAEFKLWAVNSPRKNNFYKQLEINTFRELPEIDVGMVTSSLGIIVLKSSGFKIANSIFQLISAVLILILLLLFHFHTDDKLLENYTRLELVILGLSYIILSILVGGSSTIAIKEYDDICTEIFYKKEKSEESNDKFIFYFLSGLSLFLIMPINKKIFKSFKDIKSIWSLMTISGIILGCFFLSLIFHNLFMIPVITKREKMKEMKEKLKNEENVKFEKKDKQLVDVTKLEKREDESQKGNLSIDINDNYTKNNKVRKSFIENIKPNISESTNIRINHSFQKEHIKIDEISIRDIIGKSKTKKPIYSTKICTLCGYIYLRKEIHNKKACICYYYTDKCTWLREKICKYDVLTTVLLEFCCQFCIVGYKKILSEKLLNVYSYSKILKFFIALFIISLTFGISSIPQYTKYNEALDEKEKEEDDKNERKQRK